MLQTSVKSIDNKSLRVMVWVGVIFNAQNDLNVFISAIMNIEIYRDEIIDHRVKLFRVSIDNHFLLMDDNPLSEVERIPQVKLPA